MRPQIISFLKLFIPFSVVLFIIQYVTVEYLLKIDLYYSTLSVYAFHIIATFLIYLLLIFVHKNFSDKTGFAFMGTSLFKMFAAVVFLLPMMLNSTENRFPQIVAFFIPYFLFLVFETIYAVKLINRK